MLTKESLMSPYPCAICRVDDPCPGYARYPTTLLACLDWNRKESDLQCVEFAVIHVAGSQELCSGAHFFG